MILKNPNSQFSCFLKNTFAFDFAHSIPNPVNSICIASLILRFISPYDLYGGNSMRLKHVCARGKMLSESLQLSMVKCRMSPSRPCNAPNPSAGTRQVPVENCRSRARSSSENSSSPCTSFQNHLIILWLRPFRLYSPWNTCPFF